MHHEGNICVADWLRQDLGMSTVERLGNFLVVGKQEHCEVVCFPKNAAYHK